MRLIEKHLIPSPSIHLCLFLRIYICSGSLKQQDSQSAGLGRKILRGNEVALLVQTEIQPPPHQPTQSFLFYLTGVISRPHQETKAQPLTVSQRRVRRTKATHTSALLPDGAFQLPYYRIAGESHCVLSHGGISTIWWVSCL